MLCPQAYLYAYHQGEVVRVSSCNQELMGLSQDLKYRKGKKCFT